MLQPVVVGSIFPAVGSRRTASRGGKALKMTTGTTTTATTAKTAPATALQRLRPTARAPSTSWDRAVPPSLRPLVRAYLLGYASSVVPRLFTVLLAWLAARKRRRRRRRRNDCEDVDSTDAADDSDASLGHAGAQAARVLRNGLAWRRFPAFGAALVGGSTLLERPLRRLLDSNSSSSRLSETARTRLARSLAAFVSACFGLRLLQQSPPKSRPGVAQDKTKMAGRTLDLTLFAVTRAADVVVGELWARHRASTAATASTWRRRAQDGIGRLTDPALFAVSSALVMWTWMYWPARLPRAYDGWITSAAAVDGRLIEALRRCRRGELRYGGTVEAIESRPPSSSASLVLQGMCRDYGWPLAWGDPAVTVPFPCEMVHMDCGPSCEWHALMRLVRSWRWAMATYLPLSCVLALRGGRRAFRDPRNSRAGARLRALAAVAASAGLSAARSSAFLAVFITLFYYGVCLSRTRLAWLVRKLVLGGGGSSSSSSSSSSNSSSSNNSSNNSSSNSSSKHLPAASSAHTTACQAIDGGLCTAAGCALCGWSILLERASRRKDMALFVAPRALASLLPRRYAADKQWRETLVFAVSTAVVFAAVQENPRRVRGVMGALLSRVLVPA